MARVLLGDEFAATVLAYPRFGENQFSAIWTLNVCVWCWNHALCASSTASEHANFAPTNCTLRLAGIVRRNKYPDDEPDAGCNNSQQEVQNMRRCRAVVHGFSLAVLAVLHDPVGHARVPLGNPTCNSFIVRHVAATDYPNDVFLGQWAGVDFYAGRARIGG